MLLAWLYSSIQLSQAKKKKTEFVKTSRRFSDVFIELIRNASHHDYCTRVFRIINIPLRYESELLVARVWQEDASKQVSADWTFGSGIQLLLYETELVGMTVDSATRIQGKARPRTARDQQEREECATNSVCVLWKPQASDEKVSRHVLSSHQSSAQIQQLRGKNLLRTEQWSCSTKEPAFRRWNGTINRKQNICVQVWTVCLPVIVRQSTKESRQATRGNCKANRTIGKSRAI